MSTSQDLTTLSRTNEELVGRVKQPFSTTSLRHDAYLLLRALSKEHTSTHIDLLSNTVRSLSLLSKPDRSTLLTLGEGYKVLNQLSGGTILGSTAPLVLPKYRVISEARYEQLLTIERNQEKG